jgi:hypothetical protein
MNRASSMQGREEECMWGLGIKIWRKKTTRRPKHRLDYDIIINLKRIGN